MNKQLKKKKNCFNGQFQANEMTRTKKYIYM